MGIFDKVPLSGGSGGSSMLTAPAAVPSVPRAKVERPAERVAVASGSAPAVPNDRASAAAAALAALMAAGTDSDLRADFDALALRVDALANREPAAVRFVVNDRPGAVIEGARPELSAMVRRVACGFVNLWMSGPAGSGKTTLGHDLAKALGRPFGFQSFSAASTEGSLIGSLDAQGNYRESAFVQAYENGGVYLLDEVDAAPAEVLVAINAALANGHLALPRHTDPARRIIKRHPDTVVIAAGNTWGTGATAQYCGRAPIDAATLDRFVGARFSIGYDARIEESILEPYGADGRTILGMVREWREKLASTRVQKIVSTRAVIAAARMLAAGFSLPEIESELTTGWTTEEKGKVL